MTVIALIVIGILLIVLNVNAIKKEKRSFSSALKNEEENMTDYQIEIGKFRREFSETVLELQKEIEGLRSKEEINSKVKEDLQEKTHKHENNSININDSFGNKELIELINKEWDVDKLSPKVNKLKRNYPKKEIKQHIREEVEEHDYSIHSKDSYEENVKSNKEELVKENVDINSDENKNVDNELNGQDKVVVNNKGNGSKVNEIKSLLDEGLSIEEIAEKIGIGKGEVLLIKDLYVK